MATVHSFSHPPSAGGGAPRGPMYQVATRELSADFAQVGTDQESRDLGSVDVAQFGKLLEQLAAIESIKLVDADPQLIVTVKSGRFLIQPQSGKLLVRPANGLDQMFFKLSPAEIPSFLDDTAPPPPKRPSALVNPTAISAPPTPTTSAPVAPLPPARKSNRALLLTALIAFALIAAGIAWIIFAPTPAITPPAPAVASKSPPAFDLIASVTERESLQKRFIGTYATSGDAGERMLELRDDGTFHYQEFGSSLAVTTHDSGTYTFALRHGTKTPVLRAGRLGAIELRDDYSLVVHDVVFTRLPSAAK